MATRAPTIAEQRILDRVAAIPPGFVRSYADVSPGSPRAAGAALHRHGHGVPWHRVVHSDGSVAKGEPQRRLLRREGIPFQGERVAMDQARLDVLDAS